MISFIVIGRNEGWKLSQCFEYIFKTIEYNRIKKFEIIYVDSASTDDSLERANSFKNISVFSIIGEYNAAIARNIGALESNGDILFFVDGDFELLPAFLGHVLTNDNKALKYECVAGYLDHMYYSPSWKFLDRVPEGYKKSLPSEEITKSVNGGIFLIKRRNWDLVNGMKTKYSKNQDLDMALRLTKKGLTFTRVPFLMGLHHTIDYRNENRMWKILFSDSLLYPAVTTRDHLFSIPKLKHTIRRQYTAVTMLITTFLFMIHSAAALFLLIIYLMLFLTKVYKNTLSANTNSKNKVFYFFKRILFQFIADILFWTGFLFFYPKEKKMIYNQIPRLKIQ